MATTASLIRGQTSGTQLIRTLERVLEDAELTGEVRLSGRKLKEFPKIASKYNLADTVVSDLSKNRFTEIPVEVCEFLSMERMDCYNNVIRSIPELVIRLQSLTHLNLSRNQLTTLPEALCKLMSLQVLIISNNKLVSLPEEIGRLEKLTELDVSCNEISYLPPHIEELDNLRSLNLRRNLLVELPLEITNLRLIRLDISGNRISSLPIELRLMDSLIDLMLHNNPLSSPPSYLCTRGRVHIFKYLEIQALKEDKKRGVIDSELQQLGRNRFDLKLHNLPLDKRKRCTIDSGYNTSEGSDKRWSQEIQDMACTTDEAQMLLTRSSAHIKRTRQQCEWDLTYLRNSNGVKNHSFQQQLGAHLPFLNDGFLISTVHETEEEIPNQQIDIDRLKLDDWKKADCKELFDEEQWKNNRKQYENDKESLARMNSNRSSSTSLFSGLSGSDIDGNPFWNMSCDDIESLAEKQKTYSHIQTYREYKEALRQQRAAENFNIYRRPMADGEASLSSEPISINDNQSTACSTPTNSLTNHVTAQDEFLARHDALRQQQQHHARLTLRKLEEKRKQKEAVLSYFKSRTSPVSPLPPEPIINGLSQSIMNISNSNTNSLSSSTPSLSSKSSDHFNPNFTIRREFQKAKEEAELICQLRKAIESRLKVTLPEDVSSALMDGVVLCHLANNIRPRSVASIHVPSPAVPKLTMAKCRKNVENFLDACRLIGVDEANLCSCEDVILMQDPAMVAKTVGHLLLAAQPSYPLSPSLCNLCLIFLLVATCMVLYLLQFLQP